MLPHPQPDRNDDPLGRLHDALTEMPEPGEPVYSDASEWPTAYDSLRVWLGAPTCTEQSFDDLPPDLDVAVEF